MTLFVVLSTALLYAVGVVVENIVMIREKVVGTDKELGKNKSISYTTTVDYEAKRQAVKENINTSVDGIKSQAEKTLDALKNLNKN